MMKRLQNFVVKDSLPEDVALNIVSCLEVTDVCSLGSCSEYWREICESDCIWKSLCEERWPGVVFEESDDDDNQEKPSTFKGWRGLYVKRHNEMAGKVDNLRKALCCQAINVNDYLKAIEDLKSMKFGFKDVQILLLQPKIHVLLNLVALHYCIKRLDVQVDSVVKAISGCKIQDRQVDIHWWMNGGWLHRFRLPDVLYSHCISLKDLTTDEGEEILGMLDQGITRLLVRLQISAAESNAVENGITLPGHMNKEQE